MSRATLYEDRNDIARAMAIGEKVTGEPAALTNGLKSDLNHGLAIASADFDQGDIAAARRAYGHAAARQSNSLARLGSN